MPLRPAACSNRLLPPTSSRRVSSGIQALSSGSQAPRLPPLPPAAMADPRPTKQQRLEQADPVQGNVIIQFQSPEGESTGAQGDRRRRVHAPVSL